MSARPVRARIRDGRPADAAAVLALEAVFATDRMSARSIRRFLARPGTVLVAEMEGEIVGALVFLLRRNSRWARIYSVVVHPARRGLGLGRRLVLAAEARARRAGCVGMSLEVRTDNLPAQRLYRALGYADHAQLARYYDDGAPGIRLRKPFGRIVEHNR